jgi:hypothetical protein
MLQVQGKDDAHALGFFLIEVQSSAAGIEVVAQDGHAARPLAFASIPMKARQRGDDQPLLLVG